MARRASATTTTRSPQGESNQPVNKVTWVHRDQLRANAFNPNIQAPPELALLKLSILEDGWTSPIVVRPPVRFFKKGVEVGPVLYQITDGYHRWMVSGDPEVFAMTNGMVPICILVSDSASQRLSTIRHNRARGTHHVVRMADIVAELATDMKISASEIGRRLGMEKEEVQRLLDRGSLLKKDGDFGPAWAPAAKHGTVKK